MMHQAQQFPFVTMNPTLGPSGLQPYLSVALTLLDRSATALGLLDTGATVNVLPYGVGLQLGAVWDSQTVPIRLTGNLAQVEARGLLVTANVGRFSPVRLAFAWARTDAVPLLFGQLNFFQEFDVCFFRSRSVFEIKPK